MKFTIFQHVPYESPGHILEWIKKNGHSIGFVNFYDHPALPEIKNTDALIVMGGPMNIHDDEEYSFLADERNFLKQFILSGKKVLGICLGAQMVADAMGAKVMKNEHREIGWFQVNVQQENLPINFQDIFPNAFATFHWHGDTFDLPDNVNGFVHSEATQNQGFIHHNLAAFQFHPEMTLAGIKELVQHNAEVFKHSNLFIQSKEEILKAAKINVEFNRAILFRFLEMFFG
jgi:GMP synthase-like glutamine amidotransferase